MATQALAVRGGRAHRMVVLVNDEEKARITAQARAASMSVSDFLRSAATRPEAPTEAEEMLIREALRDLDKASARSDATLARLEETMAHAANFDEAAYRAELEAEFEAMDIDWDAVGARLGFVRDEAA